MAAPATTARTVPTGFKMPEGFPITIAFASNPSVAFWEQSVKPFGEDVGDGIDTTTQHNTEWRTKASPRLKEASDVTGTAMYDPDARPAIRALVGREQAITIHYPDGSTDAFYGFLKQTEYSEAKPKESPTLNYTIVVTNWDPVNKLEVGPVHVASAGT